ncbi:MAG: SGNH/GDSL hydrolase family protein [Candidatus Omnitrophota bacterium]|jgi:lysophospholipase L1-like esterase|nr:MAG: SGNH/GDSL hydrolase family protein [Candidatus Omnitrophota bacterium]
MEKQNESDNSSPSDISTRKKWLFVIFATAASVFVAFTLCELICRFTNIGCPNRTLTGPKKLYVSDPDPNIAFRMRPQYEDFVYGAPVKINEKGLRDQTTPFEKPPGVKRILILGDSVAFGYGVPVEDTFSDQWEKKLNEAESNSRWEIINGGVPAYTTVQEVRWFETEGFSYHPDAIIVTYVMNDPEPVHRLGENGNFVLQDIDQFYQELANLFPPTILPLTDISYFMRFLNRLLLIPHPHWKILHEKLVLYFCEEIFTTPAWEDCKESLRRLCQYSIKHDIFLLVAVYPMMYRLHSPDEHPFSPHYLHVQQFLKQEGIPCIVPLHPFIGQSVDAMRAYVDDPHPSRKSHRIFAQNLHGALKNHWIQYDSSLSW